MYQPHFHPDSPARDLPNWASDALDEIDRATLADFAAAAPVDEDEDAAAPGLLAAMGLDPKDMPTDIADMLLERAYSRWCAVSRMAA